MRMEFDEKANCYRNLTKANVFLLSSIRWLYWFATSKLPAAYPKRPFSNFRVKRQYGIYFFVNNFNWDFLWFISLPRTQLKIYISMYFVPRRRKIKASCESVNRFLEALTPLNTQAEESRPYYDAVRKQT